MTHVVIWINGEPVHSDAVEWLAALDVAPSLVVAADGGLDAAIECHFAVDVLIGDLDSVSANARAGFAGDVDQHSPDKELTDLELALDFAVGHGAERITVVGGGGGRLDHEIATLLVLASERYREIDLQAFLGSSMVSVLWPGKPWTVPQPVGRALVGSTISLLAAGGSADGVKTVGLQWDLHDETLVFGSGRGISNVVLVADATVALAHGVLLAVQSP